MYTVVNNNRKQVTAFLMKVPNNPFFSSLDYFCMPLYGKNDQLLSKARAVIGTNLVMMMTFIISMLFLLATQSLGTFSYHFAYGILLPGVVVILLMLLLLKHHSMLMFCSHVTVLITALTTFSGIYYSGGPLVASCNHMLIVLVALAFFLTGQRSGLHWSAAIASVEIMLFSLDFKGYQFPNYQVASAVYMGEVYNFFTAFIAAIVLLLLIDTNQANFNQRRDRERLHFQNCARRDYLTQLANREYFESCLKDSIRECRDSAAHAALFYIDLDEFKPINDTYGHATGDKVLQIVADRLAAMVRKDDIVARLGGDEFAVLLKSFDRRRSLDDMANIIAESVSRPIVLLGRRFNIKCSVGACSVCEPEQSVAELLSKADTAMYRQKHQSRRLYAT